MAGEYCNKVPGKIGCDYVVKETCMSTKSVVLFSGGIDSATVLALALEECDSVLAVSAKYGSMHQDAEGQAATNVVDWYKTAGYDVELLKIELPNVFGGAGSALMNDAEMPHLTYQEIAEGKGPSPTVVPFRNANLLSIATAIAVVRKASLVYAGMHAEDARGFAYPDCTPMFLGPFAACIYVGTYHEVQLKVPFQWLMKADIIAKAYELGVPAHLTWSCYDPVNNSDGVLLHCGECPTCVERIQAFQTNQLVDPVKYAVPVDWDECDVFGG